MRIMLTSVFLSEMRARALRKRVWLSSLDRLERGIMNLTIRVVESVKSVDLGRELVRILAKLKEAFKSDFIKTMEETGLRRARETALKAVEWGYGAAKAWATDKIFIRYITVLEVNKPTGYGA